MRETPKDERTRQRRVVDRVGRRRFKVAINIVVAERSVVVVVVDVVVIIVEQ